MAGNTLIMRRAPSLSPKLKEGRKKNQRTGANSGICNLVLTKGSRTRRGITWGRCPRPVWERGPSSCRKTIMIKDLGTPEMDRQSKERSCPSSSGAMVEKTREKKKEKTINGLEEKGPLHRQPNGKKQLTRKQGEQ